jgi:hypothetical protein
MIAELFRYWTTLSPERVRKYGYLKRLIALEFRAERCKAAWASHVARTQAMIIKTADLVPQPRTCVILGSGLLIEVPLQALADRFERIYLVDVFHMPEVRRRMKRYFNVKLLTGDISGIFAMMKENRYPGPLQPAPAPRIPHLADADYIVSCNCMTQLAGPFNDMFRATRGFADKDCDMLAAQLMEAHAEALATHAKGVTLLITDTERFAMQGDKIVSRSDLLKGVRLPLSARPVHNEEWDWVIAPAPEEHPAQDFVHVVNARVYEHNLTDEEKDKAAKDAAAAATANDLPPELEPGGDDGLSDLPGSPQR